jgi:hypothetical protein
MRDEVAVPSLAADNPVSPPGSDPVTGSVPPAQAVIIIRRMRTSPRVKPGFLAIIASLFSRICQQKDAVLKDFADITSATSSLPDQNGYKLIAKPPLRNRR